MTRIARLWRPFLPSAWTLDIDGQRYVIATQCFTEADFEDAGNPSAKAAKSQI
jgi:hypothetical protein